MPQLPMLGGHDDGVPTTLWRREGEVAAAIAADMRHHALTLPDESVLRAAWLERATNLRLLAGMRGIVDPPT